MEPGELIGGRYRLVQRVGAGVTGDVWQAQDTQRPWTVAVKPIPAGSADEARSAVRLEHPYAVAVRDVVVEAERTYAVLPFVSGRPLGALDRAPGPGELAAMLAGVADALAAAHALGIVHRDIRPANVVVDADGHTLLTDIGVAHGGVDSLRSGAGIFLGTPGYLAPELARGEPASPAGDVYALGATMYAVLDGRPPFDDGSHPLATLSRVLTRPVPPPRNAGPLAGLIVAMLASDPHARPTAAQVAAALTGGPEVLPAAPSSGEWVDPLDTLAGAIGHSAEVTRGWSGGVDDWETLVAGEIGPVLVDGDRVDLFVPTLFGLDEPRRAGLPRRVVKSLPGVRSGVTVALDDRLVCAWVTDSRSLAHISITIEYSRVSGVTPTELQIDGTSYRGLDLNCGEFTWPLLFAPQFGVDTLRDLLGGRPSGWVTPQWDADRVTSWVVPDGRGGTTSVPGWSDL